MQLELDAKEIPPHLQNYFEPVPGLKPKDLMMIPAMVAFALRADGWYLRSEIIWAKKAPMPESVTDRPTKAHEQLFLLSKSPKYFYDHVAIAEESVTNLDNRTLPRGSQGYAAASAGANGSAQRGNINGYGYSSEGKRNKRSVWTLGPEQFAGSHFATMPTKLVEPCILAGTSAHGCCANCGSPWARVVERTKYEPKEVAIGVRNVDESRGDKTRKLSGKGYNESVRILGESWQPTCACGCTDVVPQTVLDPFCGSGTTLAVALKYGRHGIGLELNPEYIELSHKRIGQAQPLLLLEGV